MIKPNGETLEWEAGGHFHGLLCRRPWDKGRGSTRGMRTSHPWRSQGPPALWSVSGGAWRQDPHAIEEGKPSFPRSTVTIWLFKPEIEETNLCRLPGLTFLVTQLWEIMHDWSSLSNKLPWEMESKPVGTSWRVCSSLSEGKTANRDPSKVSKAGWRCKTDGKGDWN